MVNNIVTSGHVQKLQFYSGSHPKILSHLITNNTNIAISKPMFNFLHALKIP